MISDNLHDQIYSEFSVIKEQFPSLKLEILETGFLISGTIDFNKSHLNGSPVNDEYYIDVAIPEDYPNNLPMCYEKHDKINRNYHRLNNHALCLGTPSEQWHIFEKDQRLNGFIENLLIPYLFRYSYSVIYGEFPFPDSAHLDKGIVDAYNTRYGIIHKRTLISLMEYCLCVGNSVNKRGKCPCDSSIRTYKCSNHYQILLDMKKMPPIIVASELSMIKQGTGALAQCNTASSETLPNLCMINKVHE